MRTPRHLHLSLLLLGLSLALDTLTTYFALNSPFADEANPLLASLFLHPFGFLVFLAAKVLGFLLAVYIARLLVSRGYHYRLSAFSALLVVCALVFFFASVSNFALLLSGHSLIFLSHPAALLFW